MLCGVHAFVQDVVACSYPNRIEYLIWHSCYNAYYSRTQSGIIVIERVTCYTLAHTQIFDTADWVHRLYILGRTRQKKANETHLFRCLLLATLPIPGKTQLRDPSAIDWCWPTRPFIRSSSRACVCSQIQKNWVNPLKHYQLSIRLGELGHFARDVYFLYLNAFVVWGIFESTPRNRITIQITLITWQRLYHLCFVSAKCNFSLSFNLFFSPIIAAKIRCHRDKHIWIIAQ